VLFRINIRTKICSQVVIFHFVVASQHLHEGTVGSCMIMREGNSACVLEERDFYYAMEYAFRVANVNYFYFYSLLVTFLYNSFVKLIIFIFASTGI